MPYQSWTDGGVRATALDDVAAAVRAALARHGTLYAWAEAQEPRETFQGRGAAWGVQLGPARAVVRHARRGGVIGPLLGDLYLGAPRFLREIALAERLRAAGVATPAVLAAVRYPAGLMHRADVATERVDGRDLADVFWTAEPPAGTARTAVLAAVAAAVRSLHDAGFVHPDLQLKNVLVGVGAGSGAPPVFLLDVDTCRPARGRADRARNLARFFRSWEKWNRNRGTRLHPADRDAFLAAYGRAA